MTAPAHTFDTTKMKTVYPGKHAELYELAQGALFDGDGTFTDGGRLWQVCNGKPGQYLDIWPEIEQSND